jgi:hypothetical protein
MIKIYHYYKDCKYLINFLRNYRKSANTIGKINVSFEENEAVFYYKKHEHTPFNDSFEALKEFRLKLKR